VADAKANIRHCGLAVRDTDNHITGVPISSGLPMPTAQPNLFAMPQLSGLDMRQDFISSAEERTLIDAIDRIELTPFRFQGWLGKRLTASFGWRYDFDNGRFGRTDPIPEGLTPLRDRAARFAGLQPDELVQALLIRYDPGAGIGWHRDRPVFEHVIGISLGVSATLRLRRQRDGGFDRTSVLLQPRSIYHLSGEARHQWEHSIAEMAERRWSITFRSLAEARGFSSAPRSPST
jgi:alkylated DNA repair dioxygenase AlkB